MRGRWIIMSCFVLLALVVSSTPLQAANDAENAEKLYETAMSLYHHSSRWQHAIPILQEFIKKYKKSDRIPMAYLQLAWCQIKNKQNEQAAETLDELLKKYYASKNWFIGAATRLKLAKSMDDKDDYIKQLGVIARRARELPFMLFSVQGSSYGGRQIEWRDGRTSGGVNQAFDENWLSDVAWAADTDARAAQALRALQPTFKKYEKVLPPDWQNIHVYLLKKTGKNSMAEKTLEKYIDGWGTSPRLEQLLLAQIETAKVEKDVEKVDALEDKLFEKFGGDFALAIHFRGYLGELAKKRDIKKLNKWLPRLIPLYDTMPAEYGRDFGVGYFVNSWVESIVRAKDKDSAKLFIEKIDTVWPRESSTKIGAKIRCHRLLGNHAAAVKEAEKLTAKKYWNQYVYRTIDELARESDEGKTLLAKVRKQYKIPASAGSDTPQHALMAEIQKHIDDDQPRFVSEKGEEMFRKYPDTYEGIETAWRLANYFFRKVMPKERDLWVGRMISRYPNHPRTAEMLELKMRIANAEKDNRMWNDTLKLQFERFPSRVVGDTRIVSSYIDRNKVSRDQRPAVIKREFAPMFDTKSLSRRASLINAMYPGQWGEDDDNEQRGDAWAAFAGELSGNAKVYAHKRALNEYYRHQRNKKYHDRAADMIQKLSRQKERPEVKWRIAYEDIDALAKGRSWAVEELKKRIGGEDDFWGLSYRVNLPELTAGLRTDRAKDDPEYKKNAEDAKTAKAAIALAGVLERKCNFPRDKAAVARMKARAFGALGNQAVAAKTFMESVKADPWPALHADTVRDALRSYNSINANAALRELRNFRKDFGNAPEIAELWYELGRWNIRQRNMALKAALDELKQKYSAGQYRLRLENAIKEQLQGN